MRDGIKKKYIILLKVCKTCMFHLICFGFTKPGYIDERVTSEML